jgi:hypothetical protein
MRIFIDFKKNEFIFETQYFSPAEDGIFNIPYAKSSSL